ncbi:PRC-barrel domain-containing protein [Aquabacter sp. CN5-332]|uniref:PRC-barrel domain-containing protein n=1 Tax=Aquabacter sp. CN5-332 TaxID=3156608 RepID=UPI0032B49201
MRVDDAERQGLWRSMPSRISSTARRLAGGFAILVAVTPGGLRAETRQYVQQAQLQPLQSPQPTPGAPAQSPPAQDAPAQNAPVQEPPPQGAPAQPSPPQPAPPQSTQAPPAGRPAGTETPAVIIESSLAGTLLGKPVQSVNGDDMGRIVDIVIDRGGVIRAAIIDFGGFLGVGTRKIAVDWRVLHFSKGASMETIVAELSRDQLRTAPVYKPGESVVIVGRADAAPAAAVAPQPAAPLPAGPSAQAPAVPAASPPPSAQGAPAEKP